MIIRKKEKKKKNVTKRILTIFSLICFSIFLKCNFKLLLLILKSNILNLRRKFNHTKKIRFTSAKD